ncbi:ral GTPase-activating protein subunit alpha-2 [Seriola lalandi dorsalis]|uniref:ral GTPase-activating protein subunit alpha-2 n=1 Tax=Seriola lalandi dorsalis TaxID=1841481 RepID=UPI000C6F94BF|nr:ral GTPase-activating protein subunit alpha-2 [Seriola lalandi dorsalis]XP_056248933.1 ral GTPase-activating protein subunit alpha-2 isoform X1 [Seriola aureovittata]
MFTRRGHGDVKKSTQKVLDPKKDVLTRLKHLRALLDIIDKSELKAFFESNCSQIYFIFYENFITLESNLKQKGNKSQREELDSILFIFEKILQLLPEKIYNRWQFHSIGSILKKLLHTGNSFKIRCEGIRLFLLWLQALRDNCAEEQFLIFACLVPGFPAVPSTRGPCTLDTIIYNPFSNPPDAKVVPEEITPLVPAVVGEKVADDQTCYILETLLKYMVIQASSLEWKNKENQNTGFRFLFSLFKKYYLPHLFPSFTKLTNLYKPLLDLPHHRPKPLYVPVTRNNESTFCTRDQYLAPRVAFITWLVTFFLEKKYVSSAAAAQSAKNGTEVIPKLIQTVTAGSSSQEKEKDKTSDGDTNGPAGEPEKSHSNSSTLSDRRPSDSSLCSIEEEHRYVYDMVHAILLSTRDNVNFVNEVFHQAFLLPSCEASATRKVIKVYRKWILQEKPSFMTEPDTTAQEDEVDDSSEQILSTETNSMHAQTESHGHRRSSSWGRTYSFSSAISRGFLTEEQNRDIKAGIQPTLQVFLTNSSNVFLLEPCQDVPKLLENQVEVCKGVLSIYRHMIMEHTMNTQTWEQMLQVLLRITEAVMKRPQENQRKDSFAESLASILFRTIIVAWVRANLCVFISRELWDELLAVLSSLTCWEELVTEWASIMDSLTAVLARSVYGLDMGNLPLDKLSEQKEKKQRGRGVIQDSQKAAAVARSFSLSWRNQGEQGGPAVQEPMRIRSATTSGAPGVEKARNNVRQKASAKRSQSISNCVHLYEALPTTKSVPMLLHTVSSFLPGISSGNSACSHRLSDVEECQLSECGGEEELGGGDSPLPRSSSTSDITQQLSDTLPAQKREYSPTSCGSDSRTSEGRRESNEPPVILIQRSSSSAETECNTEGHTNYTRPKLREKSESISSETSNGYLNEAEVTWQAFDEEADTQSTQSAHMDVTTDPQSQGSLLLSHNEALAGPECAFPPHSAPPSYHHHNHYHYPQNPPASPALLVHTECPRDCPLDDTMHQSVLHMPHHLDSSECLADDVSIIAGGTLTGWHADSAFVLWRRILGILGDVNSIRCPKIHAKVFSYLYELWHKLAKIRDNLGISVDNQSSPPQPAFIPPLRMLASWLFRATMLPAEYKAGKLQAYKLICEMMTRHQDVLPNSDFLVHLYYIMHKGFTSDDQDVLNTIIRSCSPRFFFLGLPGFTMLLGDFITAAACVLSSFSPEAPRMEAQTVLGSLVCFPNLYLQIPVLQHVPGSDDIIVGNEDIKDYLVNILLETATKEHCEGARCIAVCSLGLWVCEELMQKNIHQQVKDAINVLGVTLKFGNKAVAQVACDVFQLLISHWEHLKRLESTLPKKIIEIFVATIAFLLPSAEHSTVEADKKLMVSLLLCLLDWCMAVPLSLLLEPITMPSVDDRTSHKAPLLDYIYRVLHCCVSGSNLHTQQSHYLLSLSDLSPDYDLMLGQVKSFEPPPSQTTTTDFGNLLTVAEEKRRRNMELIPLTARMVMTHLVNHLGHHPLSGGPALLHSLVSENHDNPYVESSELSSEVFKSPNLQLFVFNDSTLVSYLQIPAETPTVGQPPHPSSQVRVIVRDISGKYSWDGAILYCTTQEDSVDVGVFSAVDRPLSTTTVTHSRNQPYSPHKNHCSVSDSLSDCCEEEDVDVLDKLLEDLGHSSPECLPQPQLKLNQPAPSPHGMNIEQESAILEAILRQTQQEEEQVRRWDADVSFRAACQREPSHQEPKAPFYFCRLLLNDLGMNSWDRRKSFHLLKKNSKLLRELKNLDSRQCRETHKIAVFYIGEGQEDKCSILSNSAGSQAYEDFVSGLGWEVDLATHCGFMGGLQRNGSTGLTAPYYATSTVEAIFHVSTRMPSDSDDCLTKKLRHLGNDEVHIVWSEHTRDYRRGIIPTDFGDVLIIIYPMKNHMYFIQIVKKPQVPFFGPLFNGAIITGSLLPSLVRATCINASRAVKSRLTLYQSFYEERALYLEAIVQNHREVMTFEDFASQVFSPSPGYPMSGTGSFTGSTSTEASAQAGTTDSVDQVSPTMPRATKNRVSGKLRRSASAISKSSN